jgi:hypothetical protein
LVTGPGLQRRGLFYAGTIGNRLGFLRQGDALCRKQRVIAKTEISNKKYCETTIGELRKAYGADFHCFLLAMHSLPLDLKR